MMIKKLLILIIIFIACFFLFSFYLKPVVVVYNNTGDLIYLYKSTGVRNVEPDVEEVDASMIPIVIKNGESKRISLSWGNMNLDDGQLYLGWRAASSTYSISDKNGGSIFDITHNDGYCSFDVIIGDGMYKIKHVDKTFCIGKLKLASN